MEKNLQDLARLAGGELSRQTDPSLLIKGISKDTRTLEKGDLYIPIIGPNFDGHDFLKSAEEKGASASLWQKDHPVPETSLPLILVDDCLVALQTMAKNYREELGLPLIAITGSNGKTSTKDIVKSILATKFKVHATRGNENNEIGLPLTILGADEITEIIIAEMGTESMGEIDLLSAIGRPNIAVITNVGDSHLDKLKTKENVAKEKMDIVNGLKDGGILIYNLDDAYIKDEVDSRNLSIKRLSFGRSKNAKYLISDIDISQDRTRFTVNGRVYELMSPGIHQAYNAAIGLIIGQLFDLSQEDLDKGLGSVAFTSMRNQVLDMGTYTIIDDSYKANPQNLLASVTSMDYYKGYGKKILALGDMLDLGEGIDDLHIDTLRKIGDHQPDLVLLYGDHMRKAYEVLKGSYPTRLYHFASKDELTNFLKKEIEENSLVLVKGSRTMKMEGVIASLK